MITLLYILVFLLAFRYINNRRIETVTLKAFMRLEAIQMKLTELRLLNELSETDKAYKYIHQSIDATTKSFNRLNIWSMLYYSLVKKNKPTPHLKEIRIIETYIEKDERTKVIYEHYIDTYMEYFMKKSVFSLVAAFSMMLVTRIVAKKLVSWYNLIITKIKYQLLSRQWSVSEC